MLLHSCSYTSAPAAKCILDVTFVVHWTWYEQSLTWHASVADLEVGHEVFGTRTHPAQRRVRYDKLALMAPGTQGVDVAQHRDRAAEVTVVLVGATTHLIHATGSLVSTREWWVGG